MNSAIPFVCFFALVLLLWLIFYVLDLSLRSKLERLSEKLAGWISTRSWKALQASPSVGRLAPYSLVLLIGLVAIGVIAVGGYFFLETVEGVVVEGSEIEVFDQEIHERASGIHRESLNLFFMLMAVVGEPSGLAIMLLATSGIALYRKEGFLALWAVLTSVGGGLLNRALKLMFERARPDLVESLGEASGFSFPSGHTMGSMIVIGAIIWVCIRLTRSRKAGAFAVAAGVSGILAISASRVYLGVHWSSDIIGGLAAGIVWLTTCVLLYETIRRVRTIRKDVGADPVVPAVDG